MASLRDYAEEVLAGLLERAGLTDQETKIAVMLFRQLCAAAIATNLSISVRTVGTHRRVIYQKLDVHTHGEFTLELADALFRYREAPHIFPLPLRGRIRE